MVGSDVGMNSRTTALMAAHPSLMRSAPRSSQPPGPRRPKMRVDRNVNDEGAIRLSAFALNNIGALWTTDK